MALTSPTRAFPSVIFAQGNRCIRGIACHFAGATHLGGNGSTGWGVWRTGMLGQKRHLENRGRLFHGPKKEVYSFDLLPEEGHKFCRPSKSTSKQ